MWLNMTFELEFSATYLIFSRGSKKRFIRLNYFTIDRLSQKCYRKNKPLDYHIMLVWKKIKFKQSPKISFIQKREYSRQFKFILSCNMKHWQRNWSIVSQKNAIIFQLCSTDWMQDVFILYSVLHNRPNRLNPILQHTSVRFQVNTNSFEHNLFLFIKHFRALICIVKRCAFLYNEFMNNCSFLHGNQTNVIQHSVTICNTCSCINT